MSSDPALRGLLEQAIAHHRAGRLQEAERLYRTVLEAAPHHPDANHNLGVLAVRSKQPDAGLPYFKKALAANPKQGQFWLSYVDALIVAGQVDTARQVLAQGRECGLKGAAVEALAAQLIPGDSCPYGPALEHREAGRHRAAAAWLAHWLADHPDDADAQAHFAHALSLDKQNDSAHKALKRALKINPASPVVQRVRARLLLKDKKADEALQAAHRAHQADPADPENQLILAAALGAKGQFERAFALVETALQAQPRYAEALANRALLKLRRGDPGGALTDAETAVAIKPHLVQVWPTVASLRHQSGDLPGAIAAMERVAALEADNPDHLVRLGELHRQAGKADVAIAALTQAVALAPGHAAAWLNLGAAQQQAGCVADARAAYSRALELKPNQPEIANNLGILAKDEGRWDEALSCFDQALAAKPADAAFLCNRAGALNALGRPVEAEASYRQALEIQPNDAEAHCNLGIILATQGRLAEAEESYAHALNVKPDFPEAHYHLANALRKRHRLAEAEAGYRRALAIRPRYADAHNGLGIALNMDGRLQEAETSYRCAIGIEPDSADAHSNLGITLKELGRLAEAEASYRRALDIRPDLAEAHFNLGNILKEQGQMLKAEASYRQALLIRPDFTEALSGLGSVLKDQGRFAEGEAVNRRALALKPDFFEVHSNLLFAMNYRASHLPEYCLEQAREFGRGLENFERYSGWKCVDQPERLRVGVVSGDLHSHPVGYFLEGLVTCLDPARIELIAYPTHHRTDTLTAKLRPFFSAWKPLVGKDDKSAANLIHADGVHVLLDLSGHTSRNRLPVFAAKPAPVQASWLGYFGTTGVAQIDYLIGDPHVTPPEEEGHFTETVWRLPESYLCFTPPDFLLEPGPLPARSVGGITFGSFNNLTKMNDAVVALWARVLLAVPGSRLLLKTTQLNDAAVCERTRRRFTDRGVAPDRLLLEGSSPRAELLAAYRRVDVSLDPFPYPGGTTSIEALWMGVPVISLRGDRFLSHVPETIAHNAGLHDWVAADDNDYVAKAVAWTADLDQLAGLRAVLRARVLASPLFDAPRFARHFEDALWAMWQRCQTQPKR